MNNKLLLIISIVLYLPNAFAVDTWSTIFQRNHPIQNELGPEFYKELPITTGAPGDVVLVNFELMKKLGLMHVTDENMISDQLSSKILKAFNIRVAKEGEAPIGKAIATYYADGGKDYSSGRGDGRALWLAEINVDGKTYDVSAKGTGDTGLGYKELAGHSDGLSHVADALQEYYAGEVLYRSGISDSSRILAVIKLPIKKILTGGEQVDAAVMVRVSPTNLRFAHQWRYGRDPASMAKLLAYYFKRQGSYRNLDFQQQVRKLLLDNIETSARELAYFDQSLYTQASPTKGNRLLNGQLIDFGTFQTFDLPFLDYYSDKDLGTTAKQKEFSLFWNQKLKKNLSNLASLDDIDVNEEFQRTYQRYSQIMILQRLGFSLKAAQSLIQNHPDVIAELYQASEILRTAQTKHKMPVGKMNIHAPVVDIRKVYRDLTWKYLTGTDELDFRHLMNSFSTPYSKAGYNTAAVAKGFRQFKEASQKIFALVTAEQRIAPAEFISSMEARRIARNAKHRNPGLGSRLRRMNNWRDLESKNRVDLLANLELSIEEAIDFKVSRNSPGSEAPESMLLDILSRDAESMTSGESRKAVSSLLKDWMQSRGKPLSDNATLDSNTTHLIAEEVRSAGGLSSKWMLIESITSRFEKDPLGNSSLLESLLVYSPKDFMANGQEVLSLEASWRDILVSGKEIQRAELQGPDGRLNLVTYQHDDHVYSKAYDTAGNLIFQDGPRYVYKSRSLNTLVMSSSLVHTFTDSRYQNRGLYQKAFQTYLDKNPQINGVWLNSENLQTMELFARTTTFLRTQNNRNRLMQIPEFAKFFEKMGLTPEKIQQGSPEVVERMINSILTMSLQGRVRLKSGFSFEFQPNNFGTFFSRRLTQEQTQSVSLSIRELDSFLVKSREFDSLIRSLLPESYLQFIREKQGSKATLPGAPELKLPIKNDAILAPIKCEGVFASAS